MGEQHESKLKREFREKDVNRIRNIVRKKHGEKTCIQVGYSNFSGHHVEGEIWQENGKEWTIKDGLKQTYTKLDSIKKAMKMPIVCPECKHSMKHRFDSKMYQIHAKCFNCVVSMESLMRMNGTYMEYAQSIVKKNLNSYIKDAKDFIVDFVNETGDVYNEQGDKQEIVGGLDKKELATKWLSEINELQTKLKDN